MLFTERTTRTGSGRRAAYPGGPSLATRIVQGAGWRAMVAQGDRAE